MVSDARRVAMLAGIVLAGIVLAGIVLAGIVLAAACLAAPMRAMAADQSSMLSPHGLVALQQRGWFFGVLLAMAIVVLPVFLLTPLIAWRYRRGNARSAYRPDWSFSWPIEFVIWGVPSLVVAVMAYGIIVLQTRFDPYRPVSAVRPLDVDVVGLNWKWLFIYPGQHVASVGTLAFPADRPVRFHLTSDKTMQSFSIPSLGSQIYAMAGMVTELNLVADGPGRFVGQNTQYNGDGFQNDKFAAVAMAPADFATWVADARASGRTLDTRSFGRLAKDGTTDDARRTFGATEGTLPGFTFADVQPGLFGRVVHQFHEDTGVAGPAVVSSAP